MFEVERTLHIDDHKMVKKAAKEGKEKKDDRPWILTGFKAIELKDFKQFASPPYMDSSTVIPDPFYTTTVNVPQPSATDEDITTTNTLLQIPFKCDQRMDDIKTDGKRFIKKQKHGIEYAHTHKTVFYLKSEPK
uniref:Uncharacterized protein n=1 Tax=Setaria digitata TaxID=48799 RepID=A0A915Q063_9BILA